MKGIKMSQLKIGSKLNTSSNDDVRNASQYFYIYNHSSEVYTFTSKMLGNFFIKYNFDTKEVFLRNIDNIYTNSTEFTKLFGAIDTLCHASKEQLKEYTQKPSNEDESVRITF
tara:strand:+ start:281 stop:619 length:339 start_codon:yes stop_codon:yes gene_type:complete